MAAVGRENAARTRYRAWLGARGTAHRWVFAVLLVCGWSPQLGAQQVQFRQHARLYTPTRLSLRHGGLDLQQKIGLTVGARMTVWFSPRFNIATAVDYVPGFAVLRAGGEQLGLATGSHFLTATIGAMYWLIPRGRGLSWEVHTGAGIASGGEHYDDLFQGSTLNTVLGTVLSWEIGQLLTLRLKVQDRLYRFRLGGGEPVGASNPLRVSFSVGVPFLKSVLRKQGIWR